MSNGKNRVIREELEHIYGKGCMFQKAYVADRIRQLGVSLTYGTFKKKYTLNQQKTLERRMTLHHMKHVSEGGKTTLENGAVINELAHRYLHSLKRHEEERANDMIREWKRDKDNGFEPFTPKEESHSKTAEDLKHYEPCEIQLEPEEEIELPGDFNIAIGNFSIQGKFKAQKVTRKKHNKTKHKKKTKRMRKRDYRER